MALSFGNWGEITLSYNDPRVPPCSLAQLFVAFLPCPPNGEGPLNISCVVALLAWRGAPRKRVVFFFSKVHSKYSG